MQKTQHYIQGQWLDGAGAGIPILDSVTGEHFTNVTTDGLDTSAILQYGRDKGSTLRKMTFQERGLMLKKLALYLNKRKEQFYELSYRTGATRIDSWIDIEGGFGNLFANASGTDAPGASYNWTVTSSPVAYSFTDTNENPTDSPTVIGTYVYEVTATNGSVSNTNSVSVEITSCNKTIITNRRITFRVKK